MLTHRQAVYLRRPILKGSLTSVQPYYFYRSDIKFRCYRCGGGKCSTTTSGLWALRANFCSTPQFVRVTGFEPAPPVFSTSMTATYTKPILRSIVPTHYSPCTAFFSGIVQRQLLTLCRCFRRAGNRNRTDILGLSNKQVSPHLKVPFLTEG